MKTKAVIGIIGPIGSGKDTVANCVAHRLQVPVYQISQPLKEIARNRGIEPTRENLTELGTTVATEEGEVFLARVLLDQIDKIGVISGMRQLQQIAYLRQNANLVLIAVNADPTIRFERVRLRHKPGEAKTLEEFIKKELDENSGHHVQRLFECLKLADYHIENNFDLDSLYCKVDDILSETGLT